MCSTDEQQWQESGWNGVSLLQEAPHLRQLPPTLDGARHNTVQEMQPGAREGTEGATGVGTTSEMSKGASACGATSDPRLPPTSAARSAKPTTLIRSDSVDDQSRHHANRSSRSVRQSILCRQEFPQHCRRNLCYFLPSRNSQFDAQIHRLHTPHHFVPRISQIGSSSID